MKNLNEKVVHKENYMKRDNIGEDLLLKNQVLMNLDDEIWIRLAFKSNVFYKSLLREIDIYHPNRFVNIKLVDI